MCCRFVLAVYAVVALSGGVFADEPDPHDGMRVRTARQVTPDQVDVETLGARIIITSEKVTLVSTLDYTTGRTTSLLPVGELTWDEPIGSPTVAEVTPRRAVIETPKVRIIVHGDSLIRIDAVAPVSYVYASRLDKPEWVKGHGVNRMWALPRGGSLHLLAGGESTAPDADSVRVSLPAGNYSGLSVFPPKPFDAARLYGPSARPHVFFVYSTKNIARYLAAPDEFFGLLTWRRFGTVVLFGGLYTNEEKPVVDHDDGLKKYTFTDLERVRAFIAETHRRGFKVITYMKADYFAGQHVDVTRDWMRKFQREHQLDGWYFDNADIAGTWWKNYAFLRSVRDDVGSDGILYHHDSVDTWGGWSGAVFVPADAYVDYTLKGETGRLAGITGPEDLYLRYYTRGFSGNLADHKLSKQSTLSRPALMEVLAKTSGVKRLGSLGTNALKEWDRYYRIPFNQARDRWRLSNPNLPAESVR